MANKKISQLTAVTSSLVGASSYFPVVDSADTTTKRILLSELDGRWAPKANAATVFTPVWTVGTSANINHNVGRWWRGYGHLSGCMILDAVLTNKTGALGIGSIITLTIPNSQAANVTFETGAGLTFPNNGGTANSEMIALGPVRQFKDSTAWQDLWAYLDPNDATAKTIRFHHSAGALLDSDFPFTSQGSSLFIRKLIIPISGW